MGALAFCGETLTGAMLHSGGPNFVDEPIVHVDCIWVLGQGI